MTKDLRERLEKDLEKSGFAAEMRAIDAIRSEGWGTSGSGTYVDLDLKVTRSVDVKAYRVIRDSKIEVALEYEIFGEVKKTERPWIVFRREEEHPLGDGWHHQY